MIKNIDLTKPYTQYLYDYNQTIKDFIVYVETHCTWSIAFRCYAVEGDKIRVVVQSCDAHDWVERFYQFQGDVEWRQAEKEHYARNKIKIFNRIGD